jgi:hypothetical protein
MPNGHDKNYRRLLGACAAFRHRFGEWPTHARFEPGYLADLVSVLDDELFERLALHMELRTTFACPISVGGARGYVEYGGQGYDEEGATAHLDQAEKWLHLTLRREGW